MRQLIVIATPPTMTSFKQITCLMSDEELAEARAERPDLIFRTAADLKKEMPLSQQVLDNNEIAEEGFSIYGMTPPPEIYK